MAHLSPEDFKWEMTQLAESLSPNSQEGIELINQCILWGTIKNGFLVALIGFILFWLMDAPETDLTSKNWRSASKFFLMIVFVYSILELMKVLITPEVYLMDKLMC